MCPRSPGLRRKRIHPDYSHRVCVTSVTQCTQNVIQLGSVVSTPQIYKSQCSTAPLVADCITTNGVGGLTQTDGSCLAYPSAKLQPNCYTANGSGGLIQVNNQIVLQTGPLTTCQAFPLNPSYIVQTGATPTPAIVATALRGYESAAVAAVQHAHNLTTADDAIILDSARNEVRAFLFAQLLEIAQQTTPRSASDQAVMDYYAQKIAAINQTASQYALSQYNSWSSTICNGSPAGTGWSPVLIFRLDLSRHMILPAIGEFLQLLSISTGHRRPFKAAVARWPMAGVGTIPMSNLVLPVTTTLWDHQVR